MAAARTNLGPDPAYAWHVYGATCIGATHTNAGKPREDAWATSPESATGAGEPVVAVALADGHGHDRHFRSARGSELAVEVATAIGLDAAHRVREVDDAAAVEAIWRERAGSALIAAWRGAVEQDVRVHPFRAGELAAAGLPDDVTTEQALYAYGATLILAVAAGPWLLSAQIGDGDMFGIAPDGALRRLVLADPRLDGSRTTSLCQADALDSMRFGVAALATSPVGAVVLATDGYGNAQVHDDWDVLFGRDIAALAAANGPAWIGAQLPRWAEKCASLDGSGDDVTIALMFAAGTSWQPTPPVGTAPAGTGPVDTGPTQTLPARIVPAGMQRTVAAGTDRTVPIGTGRTAPAGTERTVPMAAVPARARALGGDATMPIVPAVASAYEATLPIREADITVPDLRTPTQPASTPPKAVRAGTPSSGSSRSSSETVKTASEAAEPDRRRTGTFAVLSIVIGVVVIAAAALIYVLVR